MRDSPSELHAAALEAVLEVAATDPPSFAGHYRHRVAWLQGFLSHVDASGNAQLFSDTACNPLTTLHSGSTIVIRRSYIRSLEQVRYCLEVRFLW